MIKMIISLNHHAVCSSVGLIFHPGFLLLSVLPLKHLSFFYRNQACHCQRQAFAESEEKAEEEE